MTRGLFGSSLAAVERRLAIADSIEEPWEVGDIFAMGAWTHAMIGNYAESIRPGSEGRNRARDQAEEVLLHNTNWVGFAEFERGSWDRALELFRECDRLLGDVANYRLAWSTARSGGIARAWTFVDEVAHVDSRVAAPFKHEVVADLLAISERWGEVPGFLREGLAYAADAGLRALPAHLDRLEGRVAVAEGRSA